MAEPNEGKELAIANDPNKSLADWGFQGLQGKYFTSLQETVDIERKALYRLLNEPGDKPDQWLNKPLVIQGVLLMPAFFMDEETGEEVASVVTKLLLADGKAIETHSKGVVKSAMLAIRMIGVPSKKSPWKAMLKQQPLRGKKSWMVLSVEV